MLQLLASLPRRNQWIFSSPGSADGRLTDSKNAHTRACKIAGLDGLTLHGLRRSFESLTEWLEVPVGVVARIQGHKPSATAEKHYTVRPPELLRVHHEKIERWIVEQAGIKFDAKARAWSPARRLTSVPFKILLWNLSPTQTQQAMSHFVIGCTPCKIDRPEPASWLGWPEWAPGT